MMVIFDQELLLACCIHLGCIDPASGAYFFKGINYYRNPAGFPVTASPSKTSG